MALNYKILDNPVWYALQTVHKSLALGNDLLKRYPSDVLQILGYERPLQSALQEAEALVNAGDKVFIVGELAPLPPGWTVLNRIDSVQMTCETPGQPLSRSSMEIVVLTEADYDQMYELVNLVQPGYFHKNTPVLGSYFGIKHKNQLIAMAGERLRITDFTEISAVVTHPAFTGKGCAQQLVAHLSRKNLNEGCLPFLHFLKTNTRAGKVYELLGYQERRTIPFWQIQRLPA